MLKAIFIGHPYHQKTQSHQFFTEMLEQEFTVDYRTVNIDDKTPIVFPNIAEEIACDVVIFWQIKPEKSLLKNISYRKIIFFPMYDACYNWHIEKWIGLSACHIICFSKTLYTKLYQYGFDVAYFQYFPEILQNVTDWGNPNSCFHWFRLPEIKTSILNILLPTIDNIHIHQAPDPSFSLSDNDIPQGNVTTSEWFDTKQELNTHILNYGLYLAPRMHEGIGMSFLEAMSMGRCVIAPNIPTMNEYVQHKVNGLLYDSNNPQAFDVTQQDIIKIQKNAYAYMTAGYERWQQDKQKLIEGIKFFSIKMPIIKKTNLCYRNALFLLRVILFNPMRIRRIIKAYIKKI